MKKGRSCVTPEHSSSENLRGTSSKATVAYSIYIINIGDNSEEPIGFIGDGVRCSFS